MMMYEKEFALLKSIYEKLPEPSREAVKMIAYIPLGAVLIFGVGLMPLGIIGLGGVLVMVVLSFAASITVVAFCVPFEEDTGIPQMKREALEKVMSRLKGRKPAVTVKGAEKSFDTGALPLMAANDSPAETAISLEKQPNPVKAQAKSGS